MSQNLRLFYALWPDEDTREKLAAWQFILSGRKVPPENLHITLAFLGEQPETLVPALIHILQQLPAGTIPLQINKTGFFSHNRIHWAGMKKASPALIALHKHLVAALAAKGITFDKRHRFAPHITLARNSRPAPTAGLTPVLWQANHLVLVQSRVMQDAAGRHPYYSFLAERWLDSQ